MTNAVCDNFQVPHDLWNRSADFYCHNAVLAPQLHSIVSNFPAKYMVMKESRFNELKKADVYTHLINVATRQEDIFVQLLQQF